MRYFECSLHPSSDALTAANAARAIQRKHASTRRRTLPRFVALSIDLPWRLPLPAPRRRQAAAALATYDPPTLCAATATLHIIPVFDDAQYTGRAASCGTPRGECAGRLQRKSSMRHRSPLARPVGSLEMHHRFARRRCRLVWSLRTCWG